METAQVKDRCVRSARHVAAGVNQLLWPAVCVNCRTSISEDADGLCRQCWDELLACAQGDYCRRCGRDASRFALLDGGCAHCRDKTFAFDAIVRAGVYAESLQHMIVAFKNGRTELDALLGRMAGAALEGGGFERDMDLLVPVPLHWTRRVTRGYNQSLVLAKRIKPSGVKISTELVRMRRTKMQPAMASDAARRRNVAGAFAVRRGHRFAGSAVCLVDDIKTTGATLHECASVLKDAGARYVYALVLAVAGQKTN